MYIYLKSGRRNQFKGPLRSGSKSPENFKLDYDPNIRKHSPKQNPNRTPESAYTRPLPEAVSS